MSDGGPAFPHDGQSNYTGGATLRDYFAAAALTGLCVQATAEYERGPCNAAIVERSWIIADAMLKAREVDR